MTNLKIQGGPIMLAILVVMGTKYACNLDHVGDQICLQSQSRRGPYMPAIPVKTGTIYACNLGHDRDQICLQSWFKRGPNMPAISVSIGTIYACNLDFFKQLFDPRRSLSRCFKNFRDCRHIICRIYGPQRDQDCAHIWSLLQPKLQA